MPGDPTSWALAAVAALFVAFLWTKLLGPVLDRDTRDIRRRIVEEKRKGSARGASPSERAAAWRRAATIALEELERPRLAASYARRAERVDPEDDRAVGLVARALTRGGRYRSLERFLWRRIAAEERQNPAVQRALEELIRLYDGPLRRPEMAVGLRRMWDGAG